MIIESVEHLFDTIAYSVGIIGIIFIVIGIALALRQYIHSIFSNKYTSEHVRLTLGTYILTGIGFMIGQDIIETVLHTSRDRIIDLGLIVIIRTILEYFLNKEISHLQQHIAEHSNTSNNKSH